MSYSIYAYVFPIEIPVPGIPNAGHLYLDFYDDQGNLIAQFNGLETDRNTGLSAEKAGHDTINSLTGIREHNA
jgi:hypothetical protein